MKDFWNWFLANGDKILAFATTEAATLQASGMLDAYGMKWVTLTLASLTVFHNTFLPEPQVKSKSEGG